jgi:hypothetical protein
VLKPMIISTIITESFPTLRKKKKKQVYTLTPKLWTALVQGGENDMNITMPTAAASNSSNPIHIQFGTFSVELKRDDENNIVPVVPCLIKIKGRNFIKRVTVLLCQSLGRLCFKGERMMSSWLLKLFYQAIRSNELKNIIKNMISWV